MSDIETLKSLLDEIEKDINVVYDHAPLTPKLAEIQANIEKLQEAVELIRNKVWNIL